jgi:hypothetical protein
LQLGEVIRLPRRECIWLSTDADAAAEVLLISAYFERSGFRLLDRVASLIFRWVALAAPTLNANTWQCR